MRFIEDLSTPIVLAIQVVAVNLLFSNHRVVIACFTLLTWVVRGQCILHCHFDLLLLEVRQSSRVHLPLVIRHVLF